MLPEIQCSGAVIYTDGSARPNPGNTGWGLHGYIYNEVAGDKKQIAGKNHIPTKFGYIHQCELGQNTRSVPVIPEFYLDGYGTGCSNASNNAAEVDAFLNTLRYFDNFILGELQILTDSQYLKNGVTVWRAAWEASNFFKPDGNVVSNKEKWVAIYESIDKIKAKGTVLLIDWVKGHNDIFGNVLADELAKIAVLNKAISNNITDITSSAAKGYWRHDVEKHPLIDSRRLYFNSQMTYNVSGTYYLADPGKDEDMIAKKTPETSYSVVKLFKPDELIDQVIKKQCDVAGDINSIIMLKLDRLYSPDIYKRIKLHGPIVLFADSKRNISLNYIDDKPVTVEQNPAGLSLRAIDSLAFLEHVLQSHLDATSNDKHFSNSYDITSHFYDVVENTSKLKLKNTFGVGVFDTAMKLDVALQDGTTKNLIFSIIFGLDIIGRNGLKKIEDLSPTISLLTWYESDHSLRYAVVIKTTTGVGIWCNFYSNNILY